MRSVYVLLYLLCIIGQFFSTLLAPFNSGTPMIIAVYAIHVCCLTAGVALLVKSIRSQAAFYVLLFTVCFISAFFSGGLEYNTIVKILCFFEMLIAPNLAMHVAKKNTTTIDVVVEMDVLFSAFAFVYHYSLNLDNKYKVYFLGFNKNYTGLMLILVFSAALVIMLRKNGIRRVIWGAMALVLGSFVLMSRCRSAMVVLIIELLFFIKPVFVLLNKVIRKKWMSWISLLFPVVFMGIMMVFPSLNSLTILDSTGSILDGREQLYINYFGEISNWWLFGNVNKYAFQNAHNGTLAILITIGFAGLVLWLVCQSKILRRVRCSIPNDGLRAHVLPYYSILCVYLLASMEAAIYVHGQHIAVMLSILFYYAARDSVTILKDGILSKNTHLDKAIL